MAYCQVYIDPLAKSHRQGGMARGFLPHRERTGDEATAWYGKSIQAFSDNPVAHQNLAVACHIQGKLTEAIAEYELRVRLGSGDPEGHYGLGTIYLDLNETQEALAHLQKAEELYAKASSPWISDARYALGLCHYMLNECTQAQSCFELISSHRGAPCVGRL